MSKILPMIVHYFDCECHSPDHTIRVVVDPGVLPNKKDTFGSPPEMYCEVQLNRTHNWYQRIWAAAKYVFGYECRYGHWDCWLLKQEDADRLDKVLTEYKIHYERWEKERNKYATIQQDSTTSNSSSNSND